MKKLEEIVKQIEAQNNPPVDRWQPKHEGSIDIYIDSQGNWFHEGDPIVRQPLVKLFASILWFDGNHYSLVTPVERMRIEVADVPFLITSAEIVEDAMMVTTNLGEWVVISPERPVQLRRYAEQYVPYVNIRHDLWARVNRSIYIQWVESALDSMDDSNSADVSVISLRSQDYEFEIARL